MLTGKLGAGFYMKHFQDVHKRDSIFTKPACLRRKSAGVIGPDPIFLRGQPPQTGTIWELEEFLRKLLWLIPFTLAKILLMIGDDRRQKNK
jgi:hypothetical protein